MKKLNPEHVKAVVGIVNDCPYFRLLSAQLVSLSWGESHLELEVQQKHFQPYGLVHGGVCASILDAAAFWAVYACFEDVVGLTTVEIKVNYLAPVKEGRLIAKGRCIKAGKSIGLGDATIEDDKGRLVAHGTSTLMVIDSMEIKGQATFPPKFL
ncbi:MAG TPA: PaaI family thioesterase [Desulfobacteraceae bacterium]|nr:PaaI family thioesterase [Desulfobacteraceae bacterium]